MRLAAYTIPFVAFASLLCALGIDGMTKDNACGPALTPGDPAGAGATTLVSGSVRPITYDGHPAVWIIRVWDDGAADRSLFATIDDNCDLDLICSEALILGSALTSGDPRRGPASRRVVDSWQSTGLAGTHQYLYRFWSDGSVDRREYLDPFTCGAEFVCEDSLIGPTVPSACATDLTGDGVVGLEDLVTVLADWGLCGG